MPLIIGQSASLKYLRYFINKAAQSESNVLILGETGVGKELAAKSIHCLSKRKHYPFIKLNCCSLSENLIEEELFGHGKGSFTGAYFDRPGLIETAEGGTFFFDEIGDIGPGLQAKILSVIEDKETRRIGENCSRKIDVRFIFATNKELDKLVARGKFREDLYYRINILSVHIAPLRGRKEDIPLLARIIIEREVQSRSENIVITEDAMKLLTEYSYPGNVRELQNILKRAHELSESTIIEKENLSFRQGTRMDAKVRERRYKTLEIIEVLVKCNGNKTEAAKLLGITRVHLYRLLNSEADK